MTNSLTVLGGSAASVGTGQGCAGYLVSSGQTNIVLDLGPGTLQELRKHTDFRALDGIVISHFHVDHMLDTIAMRFSLAYNPIKPTQRVPLWLPPGGIEFFDKLGSVFDFEGKADVFFSRVFEINEYDPNDELTIGDLTLSFAPTVHWGPCWAVRVHPASGDGDLLYTADTGPSSDLTHISEGAAVIVAEATTPLQQADAQQFDKRGHITIAEAARLATDAGACILVATHMYEENDPEAELEEAKRLFNGSVVRALPGTTIRWP